MKRLSEIPIIAIFVCLLSFIGCSFNDMDKNGFTFDTDYLYVDVDTIFLSNKSQDVYFSIYCMSNWDITNSPEWLSISQLSGSGNAKIEVLVRPNLEVAFREATLFVNLNAIRKPIYIKQAPSDYVFDITPSNFSFPKDTEDKLLTIHSNVAWSITNDQDWCHVSEYSGNGDKVLSIYCDNNNTNMVRYDTLRAKTSMETIMIPVKQSGSMYYITPTINFVRFDADGGVKSVPIESNIEWTFKSIHNIVTPKRINKDEISVSLDRTTTAETRYDTIMVSDIPKVQGGEPTIKEYIYIEQKGLEPKLEIKPDSLAMMPLRFINKGGEGSFSIESNLKWAVKSSDETWCRIISDKSGSGNGSVKISVDKNPLGASRRNATITIMTSALTKVVNIYQEPGEEPYINLIPATLETLNYENVGGTQSLKVESNIEWTVESDKTYWCHIESSSSAITGNGEIRIWVDVNPAEASERNCNVVIKSSLGNKTIKVHQAKGDAGYVRTTSISQNVQPQGGTVTFDIESNLSNWTASSDKEWCKVQTASGSFNGTVSLSVELNSGTDARDATITIKSAISDVTVIVHQEPKDVPGDDDNPNPKYSRKR